MISQVRHLPRANEGNDPYNIQEIVRMDERDRRKMGVSGKIASKVTAISGSMPYVIVHIVWFTVWLTWNEGMLGVEPFDPFPFSFLTLVVSLEAIFLSVFVLISQNRQAEQDDRRAKLGLQISMIDERETTIIIRMLHELHQAAGIHSAVESQVQVLEQQTHVERLVDKIDEAAKEKDPKAAKGPESAADTET